jgi:hypothetical protein
MQPARPGPDRGWERARRAYVDLLGDDDPARAALAEGAVDLRLGFDSTTPEPATPYLISGFHDLAELREIVESAIGIGTWPISADSEGELIRARIEVDRPAAVLGLLLSMEDLIERRSPWGRWRSVVETMAARVEKLDVITTETRVIEPGA